MDVETFLCQSRKKISFSKINLLNLRKNLVGPWGSTQLGERSPKPVSQPKSDTRKVSQPSGPQNRPTCTCSTLPRASARTSPLRRPPPARYLRVARSRRMDADAAPTASGPISKGDPRLRADPDRAWTPIEPGHGGEATRAQAGWLEQAEEGAGRGVLLLASATFLRKLLNHHRNREKVEFYDQVLTSCCCCCRITLTLMRDAAAAAAELQSWGRLLIEEHVTTITILTITHACESRLSNT